MAVLKQDATVDPRPHTFCCAPQRFWNRVAPIQDRELSSSSTSCVGPRANVQLYNMHCIALQGAAWLVPSFTRKNLNLEPIKVFDVKKISVVESLNAFVGHPENARFVNIGKHRRWSLSRKAQHAKTQKIWKGPWSAAADSKTKLASFHDYRRMRHAQRYPFCRATYKDTTSARGMPPRQWKGLVSFLDVG